MDAPELPGFYYNPERKKYFRILPNHLAPRNSSFYTHNTVASLKASEQSKSQAALAASITASRTHRHHRANPFLRATFFRELGTAGTPEQVCEAVRETYARSLCRRKSLVSAENGLRCFDVMQGIRGAGCGIGGEVEEMESLVLVVGGAGGKVLFSRYFVGKNRGELLRGDDGVVDLNTASGMITSVTFSAEGKICATTLGGYRPPCTALFHLPGYLPSPTTSHLNLHPPVEYILSFARSIWCSTTNLPPPTSTQSLSTTTTSSPAATFALGSSSGITLVTPAQFGYINTSYAVPSDVFALAYLPTSSSFSSPTPTTPSTLLSASRDGGIRIHPCTTPTTTTLIYHGSLLTHLHLHPTTPHLLAAKGPQKTALYDLRYTHPASPSMYFKDPTRAVLVYEDLLDSNGYQVDEGWDVSSDGGLMAGVVKNASPTLSPGEAEIGLWSVSTGRRLRLASSRGKDESGGRISVGGWGRGGRDKRFAGGNEGTGGSGVREERGGLVVRSSPKCIKFVDVPGVGEEVWAGVRGGIERFGFGRVE